MSFTPEYDPFGGIIFWYQKLPDKECYFDKHKNDKKKSKYLRRKLLKERLNKF